MVTITPTATIWTSSTRSARYPLTTQTPRFSPCSLSNQMSRVKQCLISWFSHLDGSSEKTRFARPTTTGTQCQSSWETSQEHTMLKRKDSYQVLAVCTHVCPVTDQMPMFSIRHRMQSWNLCSLGRAVWRLCSKLAIWWSWHNTALLSTVMKTTRSAGSLCLGCSRSPESYYLYQRFKISV